MSRKSINCIGKYFDFHGLLKMKLVHFSPINDEKPFASAIVRLALLFIPHCKDNSFRSKFQLKCASCCLFSQFCKVDVSLQFQGDFYCAIYLVRFFFVTLEG